MSATTIANTPEQIHYALVSRNLHWPERIDGETQDAYKARRAKAHAAARAITHPVNRDERHQQHYNGAASNRRQAKRYQKQLSNSLAQQPKPLPVRYHKPKAPIPPTWPKASPIPGGVSDQQRQSRPVIVLRPVRAARLAKESAEARAKAEAAKTGGRK